MATLAIDFASTDGTKPPVLTQAYAAGMRIAIPRGVLGRPVQGGNGKPFCDPCWELNKDRFAPAGIYSTAYLFLCYPSKLYSGTTPEPEAQAQAMFDYVKLDPLKLNYPPVIDVEMASDVLTKAQMIEWTNRAVVKLRDLYGVLPINYSSNRVWYENLGDPTRAQAGVLADCMPWIAKPWPWPVRTPIHLDGAPNYNPTTINALGDSTLWLWYQYQGDATGMPGFLGAVDANRPQVVQRGMKGSIVKEIQKRVDEVVDGDFGPKTETAVKHFQANCKLVPDGIVGVATWQRLLWITPFN